MGTLYLSEYRLRIGPTVCMLVVVMTEGPWVTGVRGRLGLLEYEVSSVEKPLRRTWRG